MAIIQDSLLKQSEYFPPNKVFLRDCFSSSYGEICCREQSQSMGSVLKFGTLLFLFSNKMLVSRAGIHKMFVRIANREDPDQTASSEAV